MNNDGEEDGVTGLPSCDQNAEMSPEEDLLNGIKHDDAPKAFMDPIQHDEQTESDGIVDENRVNGVHTAEGHANDTCVETQDSHNGHSADNFMLSSGSSCASSGSSDIRRHLIRTMPRDCDSTNEKPSLSCDTLKFNRLNRQRSLGNPRDKGPDLNIDGYWKPKSELKTTRSSSAWSLWSCSSAQPVLSPRENKVSIRRKQLAHSACDSIDEKDPYLTPFQRKVQTIKDLRQDMKECHDRLREKDEEIQELVSKKDVEASVILTGKDTEIHSSRELIRKLQQENSQLKEELDELKGDRDDLKLKNKEMELDRKNSEERHNEMYLVMYEKGMRSADFERQDKIEEMASQDPVSVPVPELLAKLSQTQAQLAQLQETTRQNQYEDAAVLSPSTDSEATLRCVRDALFHYLIANEKPSRKQHLDVMLGLIGFTDAQKRKIDKAVAKSKRKN